MADPEVERLLDELRRERLDELRADREEVLAELDSAEGNDRRLLERQLEGIDNEIGRVAERRGKAIQEQRRQQARPRDSDDPRRLF